MEKLIGVCNLLCKILHQYLNRNLSISVTALYLGIQEIKLSGKTYHKVNELMGRITFIRLVSNICSSIK